MILKESLSTSNRFSVMHLHTFQIDDHNQNSSNLPDAFSQKHKHDLWDSTTRVTKFEHLTQINSNYNWIRRGVLNISLQHMKVKYEIDTSSYHSQDEQCKYQCCDSSTERIQTNETHEKLITYGNTLKSTKKAANTILKVNNLWTYK